jgi:perosamine synthetase
MGRDALRLVAEALHLRPEDHVILPAFACREAIRPFSSRSHAEYYDVRPDLSVDLDRIRSLVARPEARALLLVNYFGFLQPEREAVRTLCAENSVVLVEDCAHSLLTRGSGDTGDIAIYSFRKTLPVPDGGGYRVTSPRLSVVPRFHPRFCSDLLALAILLKSRLRLRSSVFTRAGIESAAETALKDGVPSARNGARRFLPLSSISRSRMARARCDEIMARKRADFEFWRERVRPSVVQPIFPTLPDGVCPLGFPILTPNRDSLKESLEACGLLVRVHWRMSPEVQKAFPVCGRISRETLTLPVYPELPDEARRRAAELLSKA